MVTRVYWRPRYFSLPELLERPHSLELYSVPNFYGALGIKWNLVTQ